jgi:thiamine biosynthesis lipoprotein
VLDVRGPVGVATSATYERGQHIVDPRTGRPSHASLSATVIGPDLTFADAYATTLFVMGPAGLVWLKEQDPAYDGFLVVDQLTTLATEGFRLVEA